MQLSAFLTLLVKCFRITVLEICLTLKDPGGGWNPSIGQEIACHFSQDHAMVTKILDIIHKHPKYQLVKSFFYYLDRFSRNLAETDKTS